jgi:hypothetical protein
VRVALALVLVIVLPFVEQSFVPPVRALRPDLPFLLAVLAGFNTRGTTLLFWGCVAGLSRGVFSVDDRSLMPLLYPLAALCAGFFRRYLYRDHLPTLFLAVLVLHLPVSLGWRGTAGGWPVALLDVAAFSLYTALLAPPALVVLRLLGVERRLRRGWRAIDVS